MTTGEAVDREASRQALGKALGRVPSGVYVLSAGLAAKTTAILVSWVQQAAFEPPAVSIAVARDRALCEVIRAEKRLVLSVLGANDTLLMRRFARGVATEQDAFEGLATLTAPSGLPVPVEALAYLDCQLLGVYPFGGDHDLFVAQVTAGRVLRDGPAFVHQRGNGFHY